jgi:RNA polymerase sigma-70 factor (ECF subfamily)
MELVLRMDSRVCGELWRSHADSLLLYATTFLGDRAAAEDVLQNVFVRLLGVDSPPALESETAYLFRAVRNESLNALRSRRAAARAFERLFDSPEDDPRESLETAQFGREVSVALLDLPREEREAVVLKIWSDLSFPEAASVAGIPEKTLEHRYYRGLAALKQKLGVRHE